MTTQEHAAIVGIGAVLPDALDVPTAWRNMLVGHCAIRDLPPEIWDRTIGHDPSRTDSEKSYSAIGAVVRGFEFDAGEFGLPPVAAACLDPTHATSLVAARQALSDAGVTGPTDGLNAAVILGNVQGGAQKRGEGWFRVGHTILERTLERLPAFSLLSESGQRGLIEELREAWRLQFGQTTSDALPGLLGNLSAARIAHHYNFTGSAVSVDAACASSLAALQQAVSGLVHHEFDLAVAGGSDMQMDLPTFAGFCAMGALSPDGSYPFDRRANGFVMGEGTVVFVLKRLSDARRAGDRTYAVVCGVGASSDGRGRSLVAPNPVGQVRAMRRAYEAAEIEPTRVGYIEAHGSATPLGDPTEVLALREVFRDAKRQSIAIGSAKANIGHLKGAAGAAGTLRAALALHHGRIPPHANFQEGNPRCELDRSPVRVASQAEPWTGEGRVAAVSAFGFGGVNYHLVLGAADDVRSAGRTQVQVPATGAELPLGLGIIGFGAASHSSVLERARDLRQRLDDGRTPTELGLHCLTREAVAIHACRVAFFAETVEETAVALDAIIATLSGGGSRARLDALGVALRDDEETFGPESVAFMFPGQGSQYVGMLDELRSRFPVVQETLDEADRVMAGILNGSLSSYISPADDTDPAWALAELCRTDVLQPAMLACDEAVRRLLVQVVHPRVVMGHSLGEYGACVAADVLDFADALRIVAARGEAMEEVALADNGLMLAVAGSAESVAAAIADVGGNVVVVNKNCPSQTVIGGASQAVRAAEEKLRAEGFEAVMLPVSHAFHSNIVAPATIHLRRALARVEVRPPRVPILSNVTGDFYPVGEGESAVSAIRESLATQLASPVEFIAAIETAYAGGCRVFIEMGPKRAQAGFVKDILRGRPHRALYLAHPKIGELVQLGRAVAALVADGVVPYGRPRVPESLDPRSPTVREVEASIHTRQAATELAESREAPPRPSDRLADDPGFWHFLSLQGPAIVNALRASYGAARAVGSGAADASVPAAPVMPAPESPLASLAAVAVAPGNGVVVSEAQTKGAVDGAVVHASALSAPAESNGGAAAEPQAKSAVSDAVVHAPAPPAPAKGNGDLVAWVLDRVAEITGYEVEELDLDAHLEAELGIDSIRQIELIMALRDELELPPDDGFRVSDYANLRSLIGYLRERVGAATPF